MTMYSCLNTLFVVTHIGLLLSVRSMKYCEGLAVSQTWR